MDIIMISEKYDELLSDTPLEWLVQLPKEITSYWEPAEFGINEELVQKHLGTKSKAKGL